jgi:antitoxin component YwqK of YwqJK toxin-antitoxin module
MTEVERKYYLTGELKSEVFVINGKKEGEYKEYSRKGKIIKKQFYTDDTLNGESIEYYSEENDYIPLILSKPGIAREYYGMTKKFCIDDQNLKVSQTYIDGNLNGEYKSYHYNGKIDKSIMYIDGKKNGEFKRYHCNGQLAHICVYINDKINGECKSYYENGALKESRMYIDDKLNGEYKSYHENGALKESRMYINGKTQGEYSEYNIDGRIEE